VANLPQWGEGQTLPVWGQLGLLRWRIEVITLSKPIKVMKIHFKDWQFLNGSSKGMTYAFGIGQ
jgi:hypothetical protein